MWCAYSCALDIVTLPLPPAYRTTPIRHNPAPFHFTKQENYTTTEHQYTTMRRHYTTPQPSSIIVLRKSFASHICSILAHFHLDGTGPNQINALVMSSQQDTHTHTHTLRLTHQHSQAASRKYTHDRITHFDGIMHFRLQVLIA